MMINDDVPDDCPCDDPNCRLHAESMAHAEALQKDEFLAQIHFSFEEDRRLLAASRRKR